MRYKYQYATDEEKQALMADHSALILVEEQNIIDGNFLVFADTIPEPVPVPVDPIEQRLANIEQQNLTLMDALATIYETVAGV